MVSLWVTRTHSDFLSYSTKHQDHTKFTEYTHTITNRVQNISKLATIRHMLFHQFHVQQKLRKNISVPKCPCCVYTNGESIEYKLECKLKGLPINAYYNVKSMANIISLGALVDD